MTKAKDELTTQPDNTLDEIPINIKISQRMILRDDPIGSVWTRDDDGKRKLERVYADGDNYWAITTEELAALTKWRDDAIATQNLALLTRLEGVGKGKIIVDDRDGWMQFAQQLVEAIQSERALIEKRMM